MVPSFLSCIEASNPPSILLVPGAFHRSEVYTDVKNLLEKAGYKDVIPVDLPSVGSVVGREVDVAVVHSELAQRLLRGEDVILVGNSYGATIIREAVKTFENRSAVVVPHSGPGRILGLIMLSGYIPYISEVQVPNSKPDIRDVSPPFFRFDNEKVFWDNDLVNYPPSQTFYTLSYDADLWSSKLTFSSYQALNATATYIPYTGKFEVVYVIGTYDQSIPPVLANTYINQPEAKFRVKIIDSDHTPMLSRPDLVVEIIREFAIEKKDRPSQ